MFRALILFLFLTAGGEAMARPQVMVIESYHSEYAWDQGYLASLRAELEPEVNLSYFQLDTKRLDPGQHRAQADRALTLYRKLQPDLVVLGDDNALRLLGPPIAASGTPVVFLGVNANPRSYFPRGIPANVSGVLERPLMRRGISHLAQILPLRRVLVLFDDGVTARTVLEENFNGQPSQTVGNTLVEIRLTGSFAEWQQWVRGARAQGYDAIVVGLYHTLRDGDGRHLDEDRVMSWTSRAAPVPLFAFWSFAVGAGMTAGGLVLDPAEQGESAARMVLERLRSGRLPRLPVTPRGGTLLFSRSEMARWGLSLPEQLAGQARWVP